MQRLWPLCLLTLCLWWPQDIAVSTFAGTTLRQQKQQRRWVAPVMRLATLTAQDLTKLHFDGDRGLLIDHTIRDFWDFDRNRPKAQIPDIDTCLVAISRLAEKGSYLDATDVFKHCKKFDFGAVGRYLRSSDDEHIIDVSMSADPRFFDQAAMFALYVVLKKAGELEHAEDAVQLWIKTCPTTEDDGLLRIAKNAHTSLPQWRREQRRVIEEWFARKRVPVVRERFVQASLRQMIVRKVDLCRLAAKFGNFPIDDCHLNDDGDWS
mmetsp:Transcript_41250/g.92642  ORF Transcript_41250/g.92642 Transcript_41250/m.92642 type:complete len:265 (-) Transcript_41250:33-827(-)